MLDFLLIQREDKKDAVVFKPTFIVKKSKDLMIRGGDFYAIWDDTAKIWRTDMDFAVTEIDRLLDLEASKFRAGFGGQDPPKVVVEYLWNSRSGSIDLWQKYLKKQMWDSYVQLDEDLTFVDTPLAREDYRSKRLPYALVEGECPAYEELISTLYTPGERQKLEWAVGSVVAGDAKSIQKFVVLYGEQGSGKSTFMNIVSQLFQGYCKSFEASELVSKTNQFPLEAFKDNPLVAINHDGDLSMIDSNAILNSLISHETMNVNVKYKPTYDARFNSFLFIGTNKPVRITDAKSGLIRRLIDVSPSGKKIPTRRYEKLMSQIPFELGQIAVHCLKVYRDMGKNYYDGYVPTSMMQVTNDFYYFVEEMYDTFRQNDCTTLTTAWNAYKLYCEEVNNKYPLIQRVFKNELKSYFRSFEERGVDPTGERVRNLYTGFRWDRFDIETVPGSSKCDIPKEEDSWIDLKEQPSVLDTVCADCPAQYAIELRTTGEIIPERSWDKCTTKLSDLNTRRMHYVMIQADKPYHVIIDFDIRDADGNKDMAANIREASKWPPTYVELSKSGGGLHLHYYYTGNLNDVAPVYDTDIEQKVYRGRLADRRKLTLCNDLQIATISGGLKLKEGGGSVPVSEYRIEDERHLRNCIGKALRKEINPPKTAVCVQYICHALQEAYDAGLAYNVSDLEDKVLDFASKSTNQSSKCITDVLSAPFIGKGEPEYGAHFTDVNDPLADEFEDAPTVKTDEMEKPIVFYDTEVFPNLFILCYKLQGEGNEVVKMINPSMFEVANFIDGRYRLIGFNDTKYDRHILYRAATGASNAELYNMSKLLISNTGGQIYAATKIGFTDVYDFCAEKKSLKKWEIELGIHHQELGLDWDSPVDPSMFETVAEYCANDVIATEAVFNKNQGDYKARLILTELVNAIRGPGSHPRDSTNRLTTRLIVGDDKNPQSKFNYPHLSELFPGYEYDPKGNIDPERYVSKDVIVKRKGIYMGYDPGNGGFVFARPGAYSDVWTFDIASMHPSSIIAENGFGPYTKYYKMILDLRLAIKHKDFDTARKMFDGICAKYLDNPDDAAALSLALKIAINSVYGLTAAQFENRLRDPRNIDNWVAMRGSLFMIHLMLMVEEAGYTVVHIKTDSIKIANPDETVKNLITEEGKKFGYNFEVEDIYDRLVLVNDAVYIALTPDGRWEHKGTQFGIPYVKKSLFTGDPITFADMCQQFSSETAIYLDFDEDQEMLRSVYEENGGDGKVTMELVKKRKEESQVYHNYSFIGKTGNFIPVVSGIHGGRLVRKNTTGDGYSAVQNTKKKKPEPGEDPAYRWFEAERVEHTLDHELIDLSYWDNKCAEAIDAIEKYVSYKYLISCPPGQFLSFIEE